MHEAPEMGHRSVSYDCGFSYSFKKKKKKILLNATPPTSTLFPFSNMNPLTACL